MNYHAAECKTVINLINKMYITRWFNRIKPFYSWDYFKPAKTALKFMTVCQEEEEEHIAALRSEFSSPKLGDPDAELTAAKMDASRKLSMPLEVCTTTGCRTQY